MERVCIRHRGIPLDIKGKEEAVYLGSGFLAFVNLHLGNRNSYCKDQMRFSIAVDAHCLLCNRVLRLHVELCF